MNGNSSKFILVDTSALKALFDAADDFHSSAFSFWKQIKDKKQIVVLSNFILDETYTLIRSRMGKAASCQFREDLLGSIKAIKIVRITIDDEKEAWKYFETLPDRKLSFTDCTSFAVMKRLGLKKVFTFDKHFAKADFKVLP